MGWMQDETGLEPRAANHVALTPLSHLARAAQVWPEREALACGATSRTYAEYRDRVTRLASALAGRGVRPGDVVATLLPNVPAQVEAGFGVPACGAVLNTINIRLDPDTVAYILDHGGARVLLVDSQFLPLAERACAALDTPPAIVEVPDEGAGFPASGRHPTYEDLLATGDPSFRWIMPDDEWESLALNYTSGTTGRPKGVVYHHRGAYLMTMGTVVSWRMVLHPRLLTIVPLFHCNGWCHAWMMPLLGGTVVCLRDVSADAILDAIEAQGVTHFGAAPIVLGMLVDTVPRPLPRRVEIFTAAAPPPAATLARMEAMGFAVTHVYGLTETYGHVVENVWQPERWDALPPDERAALKARQGVAFPMMEGIDVLDADGAPVPPDGTTQGEIAMRGNAVMKGYYRAPEATAEALADGWFRSGDLGVRHPDGYVEIRDRAKDIIISGGENVSSVEVEGALMHHSAVSLAAVVALPDAHWGEVPCAFVELREGAQATEAELVAHARTRLAGFKCPRRVVFGPLPKTSTGKIQKFELRARLRAEAEASDGTAAGGRTGAAPTGAANPVVGVTAGLDASGEAAENGGTPSAQATDARLREEAGEAPAGEAEPVAGIAAGWDSSGGAAAGGTTGGAPADAADLVAGSAAGPDLSKQGAGKGDAPPAQEADPIAGIAAGPDASGAVAGDGAAVAQATERAAANSPVPEARGGADADAAGPDAQGAAATPAAAPGRPGGAA